MALRVEEQTITIDVDLPMREEELEALTWHDVDLRPGLACVWVRTGSHPRRISLTPRESAVIELWRALSDGVGSDGVGSVF